ncbi:MAG: DNA (cytosine-5-)-methyltransferase [Bacilli bacterium]|nr:DNA (cytosine-5-)-methyltransferase [Bacilli bacterium]
MKLDKVKVKEAMTKNNIKSQNELAEKLGITKNQLSLMLSGKYNPVKSRVVDLSNILNVLPSDIIDEEEKKDYEINTEAKTKSISSIELFAGAGGLALGLEKAGIDTKAFIEIDQYCCETLKRNRPNWNVINEDISKIDFKKYKGKIDLVTGGFPCQAFSYAGKKLGFNDIRGTLFYEFARCIKEIQPLMFMGENVRGLKSHDKGKTLQTILDVLDSLGYDVQYKILNASEYGVAQKRERIVIIGTKKGLGIHFEYPEPYKKITVLREALKDCPKSEGQEYSEKKKRILDLVPPGGCWIDLPEALQKEYMGKSYYSGGGKRGMARRISWDEPCLTLTCSPSQKQTERCHPDETRPFTVREYARIQSFPDDWEFSGGIGEKYKQIGNAVPVELARNVGIKIVEAINKYKERGD